MQSPIVEGMPVFDAAGEKVGTVSAHPAPEGYVVIQQGWLMPKAMPVPLHLIKHSNADGVYLTLYKEQVVAGAEAPSAMEDVTEVATERGPLDATTAAPTADAAVLADADELRLPVREEQLVIDTEYTEIGRVHIHKDVVEEEQTITQPVMREQVVVERVPVQGTATAPGPDAFIERDIDLPVMGEELVVAKRAVVSEEVQIHTEAVTETQQVSDTVRKERVTVEGADEVRGADRQRP